eukprot:Gb_24412 [translate_table: standard]
MTLISGFKRITAHLWLRGIVLVDGLPTGWPLGLETVNLRVRILEIIRASESNSFRLTTPSFSSLSSSDLDTESTRSFFPDNSITLGTLIGIRPDHTAMYHSNSGHAQIQTHMAQISCDSRRRKSCGRAKNWKSFMKCMHLDTKADDNTPSLGEFLEAQRQTGISFIDASGEEKVYVNIMSEECEGGISDSTPFFLDGHVNAPSRANSLRLHASELPVIEEHSTGLSTSGDPKDCSPSGILGERSRHRRAHSHNSCLSLVSNILVKMSQGMCNPGGKINHS